MQIFIIKWGISEKAIVFQRTYNQIYKFNLNCNSKFNEVICFKVRNN